MVDTTLRSGTCLIDKDDIDMTLELYNTKIKKLKRLLNEPRIHKPYVQRDIDKLDRIRTKLRDWLKIINQMSSVS